MTHKSLFTLNATAPIAPAVFFSAAVHELSCKQRNNNTAFTSTGSNNTNKNNTHNSLALQGHSSKDARHGKSVVNKN